MAYNGIMADAVSSWNNNIVCQYIANTVTTPGVWLRKNPLESFVSLFLLQVFLISLTSQLLEVWLQPLGQTSIVSRILGGILFGPSVLARESASGAAIFPARSILTLETAATFGLMFFLFALGVQTNTRLMFRPEKISIVIGVTAMVITLVLTVPFSLVLRTYVTIGDKLANALPYLAAFQCLTPFPNIACLLMELRMSSSDLGRIATSAAMVCDLIGISFVATLLGVLQSRSDPSKFALSVSSTLMLVISMVYIVRPIILNAMKRIPFEKPLGESYVFSCFVGILVAGFVSELIGQHFGFGPLILGMVVPDGPGLGATMIAKLDYFIGKTLYPTYLTTSGLKTDIFKIELQSLWIVMSLVFFSCLVKIAAVAFACRFVSIKFQDSIVIGLVMNARGICELVVFNFLRDSGVLTDQEFALSVVSIIWVTTIITPLIKFLYDPSKQNVPIMIRRTIQHARRDIELRILVCLQNQEDVPTILNLLEASNATEESPIAVIAILLVELAGRATSMLVAHQGVRTLQPSNSRSRHIINALRKYELSNESCVTMQTFSAITHLEMMHNDICRVALDQNATIIILPFHKKWEIDGSIGSVNQAIQNMNVTVLDKAPCSVGILVDRGIQISSLSTQNKQSNYHVGVIYIGGPDDAESLSYGTRMARHSNVIVTLIRFLLFGCDTSRERKQDTNLIDEVLQSNTGNMNFKYQEHVVKDGIGLAASLKGLENRYDLLIVGKHHQASPILMDLGAWSECPELGVVGDSLSSTDFVSSTSVLVVQQQRLPGC